MALKLDSRSEDNAVAESRKERGRRPDRGRCVLLDQVPTELRVEIYRFLFGDAPVHLVQENGTVAHVRCQWSKRRAAWWDCSHARVAQEQLARNGRRKKDSRPHLSRSLSRTHVAILRTCRRIYSEAEPILYSSLIFQVTTLESWICFSSDIRPQSLASIRHLRASWPLLWHDKDKPWDELYERFGVHDSFWHLVATKMTGLIDLALVLHYPTARLGRSVDASWHRPLWNVRGLHTFTLEIRDQEDTSSPDTLALIKFLRKTMCAPRSSFFPMVENYYRPSTILRVMNLHCFLNVSFFLASCFFFSSSVWFLVRLFLC